MNYLYYPGCSLTGTAREYNQSTKAFLAGMGVQLTELTDWTCCGASAASAVSNRLTDALPAVNLAIAETMADDPEVLVPCSACYLNLKRVEMEVYGNPKRLEGVNVLLAETGLHLQGKSRPRHLLDVLARDVGADAIRQRLDHELSGLAIAPYYGCQCLRPYAVFDHPESPTSMEPLIEATGATVHPWSEGAKCCGASHMNTKMPVALERVYRILKAARGADAVVTVCPMCQMNLEAYQDKVASRYGEDLGITILYLPQLLGMAIGLSHSELGLPLNLAVTPGFQQKIRSAAGA
ncbi:MAG: CoB--CoM heterodisulfide reductase iron-sulfur subunit B family protein [Desulfobacterales bacterium]